MFNRKNILYKNIKSENIYYRFTHYTAQQPSYFNAKIKEKIYIPPVFTMLDYFQKTFSNLILANSKCIFLQSLARYLNKLNIHN